MSIITHDFVKRLLKKGYSEEAIRQVLRESGFSKKEIKNAFEIKKPKTKSQVKKPQSHHHIPAITKVSFAAELVLILAVATSLPALMPQETVTGSAVTTLDCGYDLDCFRNAAMNCGKARVLQQQLGGNVLEFTANNCVLTKRITYFGSDEPSEAITRLTGKTMQCVFEKGHLRSSLLDGLNDLESCEGELKDALYALLRTKRRSVRIV